MAPLAVLIFCILIDISLPQSVVCNRSAGDVRHICMQSLNEWKEVGYGIKHTDTVSGREYGYCMHGVSEFADIQKNAMLNSVALWYGFEFGHAAVEMIFVYNAHFIFVISEGFEDKCRDEHSVVSCHQFYINSLLKKKGYMRGRSSLYRIMLQSNMSEAALSYEDVFNGPIKQVNDLYVQHKWTRSDIMSGQIELNHGCLWYAVHLFAKLTNMEVTEVMANISKPIIRFKRGIQGQTL